MPTPVPGGPWGAAGLTPPAIPPGSPTATPATPGYPMAPPPLPPARTPGSGSGYVPVPPAMTPQPGSGWRARPTEITPGRTPGGATPAPPGLRPSSGFVQAISDSGRLDNAPADIAGEVAAAAADPRRHFGQRYVVLGNIGSGGVGVVHLAYDRVLGRKVALKLLLGARSQSEQTLKRFMIEARTSASLRHPGIAGVYDVGDHEGTPFIAMELIEGEPLSQLTERGLKPRAAAKLVRGVAEAIDYAHGRGVLHRDLKPQNVLVEPSGRAVVVDFGLARPVTQDDGSHHGHGITVTGAVVGTPAYMAPEQATGRADAVGKWSDVYGLGAILYECLTQKPPYTGPNPTVVLASLLMRDPEPPRTVRSAVPRDLETICLKAMERSPGLRYATAGELAADLGRYLDDEPIVARPPGLGRRVGRLAKRFRAAVVATAVIVVVAGGTLGYGWRARRLEQAAAEKDAKARAEDRRSRASALLANATGERRPRAQVALLEKVLELDPDNAVATNALRTARARLQAEETAARLFAAIPGSVSAEERRRALDQVLEVFEDLAPARVERARTSVALALRSAERNRMEEAAGHVAAALEDAHGALAIEPGDASALAALTPVIMDERLRAIDEAESIQAFLETALPPLLVDATVADPAALIVRARLRLATGDPDGAEEDALIATELLGNAPGPLRADAYAVSGRARLAMQDARGAIEQLTRALEDMPRHLDALLALADAHQAAGEFRQATDCYTKVVETYPDRLVGFLRRGNLREQRGDLLAAVSDLEQALVMNNDPELGARVGLLRDRARGGLAALEGTKARGIYLGTRKVGWSVSHYEHRIKDNEPIFVAVQESVIGLAGAGTTMRAYYEFSERGDGPLRAVRYSLDGMGGKREVTGEVEGDILHLTITTPKGTTKEQLEGASQAVLRDYCFIERHILSGKADTSVRGDVTFLNPTTLRFETLTCEFLDPELKMVGGVPRRIYRALLQSPGNPRSETAYDDKGQKIYGRMGGMFVEVPEDESTVRNLGVTGIDLGAFEAAMRIQVKGAIPEDAEVITLRMSGMGKLPADLGPNVTAKREKSNQYIVTFRRPENEDLSAVALPLALPPELARKEKPRPPPSEQARALAREIIGSETKALEAVRRVVHWVNTRSHGFTNKAPELALPDGFLPRTIAEERSVATDALLHAAGIPSRAVAGYAYTRLLGVFHPHWWVEVWLGRWIPIDPFYRSVPSHHLKLAFRRGEVGSTDSNMLLTMAMTRFEVFNESPQSEANVVGDDGEKEPAGDDGEAPPPAPPASDGDAPPPAEEPPAPGGR